MTESTRYCTYTFFYLPIQEYEIFDHFYVKYVVYACRLQLYVP